jgi:hypothetical protein
VSTIELVIQAADWRAAAASTAVERAIQEQAQAAFLAMWDALMHDPTMTPREAIAAAQAKFSGAFAAELAQAFGDLLQSSIGTAQVLAMPVGEITLSARLYAHAQQVTNEVAALVREHAKGITQARELSRRLYDGYSPKDGIQRPLEGAARGELPKALRTLTEDMPARRQLTALQVAGQQQAARLKSQALRAAYLESFKAWEDGAGQEALKKRLQVAQREKNRFLADRIAQTELSRAHQTEVAGLLMDDTETTVVQVRLNPAHPKTDICDLHGRADLWGLGPGNYPKAEAPVPPFHPFCWCRLRSMPSLSAANARRVEGGEAAYLASLGPVAAARVMGSHARARQVLEGEAARKVADAGKPKAYRTTTVGTINPRSRP